MSIALLALVRNEATRWLPSLLAQWQEYADRIIALDDNSTDNTREVLADAGAYVVTRSDAQAAWGAESDARLELYRLGVASGAEWLLWLDADMGFISSPRGFIQQLPADADAVAFRLYDLWSTGRLPYYREDEYWQAHKVPRVWCVRRSACSDDATFSGRGLHSGHCPSSGMDIKRVVVAPQDMSILHYSYAIPALRKAKYDAYLRSERHLSLTERTHAESILDQARVLPLPYRPKWDVTYG